MPTAVAQVEPIIIDPAGQGVLLERAARAVGDLPAGRTLTLISISQPTDGAALVAEMEHAERACPPPLAELAAARRAYYRDRWAATYVPDVRHYLRLEDADAVLLAQMAEDVEASLGLDVRWLSGEEARVIDAPALERQTAEGPESVTDEQGRTWTARTIDRLPVAVPFGWLRRVLSLRFPVRVTLVIEGRDQYAEMMRLTGRITEMAHIEAAAADARQRTVKGENEHLMTEVNHGRVVLVRVGLSVATWVEQGTAQAADVLSKRRRDIDGALRGILGLSGVRAGVGDQARLVAGDPPLYRTTHEAAAAAFPFRREAPGHTTGVIIGEAAGTLVRYDSRRAMTGLMALFGVQGSGKSTAAQAMALQWLLRGDDVTAVDSSGSWEPMIEAAGGAVWRLAEGLTPPVPRAALCGTPAVLLDTSNLSGAAGGAAYEAARDFMVERTAAARARGHYALSCVDEGWDFIQQAGNLVQQVGRKARHLGMHMVLCTQGMSDVIDDQAGAKFFMAVPGILVFRLVDERAGEGSGLSWFSRVFGISEEETHHLANLRRIPGPNGYAEAMMIDRDPTRSTLQRGIVRVTLTPYEISLFGSYQAEREERTRLVKQHGSLVKAVLAAGAA